VRLADCPVLLEINHIGDINKMTEQNNNIMETWYRTYGYDRIDDVTVDKYTDSSVWIDDKRNSRNSDHYSYFQTFEEAKDYLLEKIKAKIQWHRQQALNYGEYWNNILRIEEPK
jgi:hypothetical protein